MKMNKVMKLVVALIIALMVASAFTVTVSAVTTGTPDTSVDLSQFNGKTDNSGASDSITNIIGAIIYIARIIGAGVAIIMLIVLAIQYIAASPEGKAEIKKKSTIYIVGAIILFAASALLGIIQRFAQNIG